MQAETSITKASIKDYFENFQTIKSLIIENPPLIDSLTILSDFDNFKFVSTKKSPTKQSLNLIINDTLRVKADVESLFNLFPAKVGDVWEFDYTSEYSQTVGGFFGIHRYNNKSGTSTWHIKEVSSTNITVEEIIIGLTKFTTINGALMPTDPQYRTVVYSDLNVQRTFSLARINNTLNFAPVFFLSSQWLVAYKSPRPTSTTSGYVAGSIGFDSKDITLGLTGLISMNGIFREPSSLGNDSKTLVSYSRKTNP